MYCTKVRQIIYSMLPWKSEVIPVKEELLKRLDGLADKLGLTVNHLWQIWTKQGYIEAYFAIFWIILATPLVIFACFRIGKTIDEMTEYNECSGKQAVSSVVLGFLAVIFLLTALLQCSDIAYLFNPELYALEQVKSILRAK